MNRRAFVLCLGVLSLTGCASLPTGGGRPVEADPDLLESVYGVVAGPDGVTVRVASGGCTLRAGFAVYVDRTERTPVLLFARRRLDRCQTFDVSTIDLLFTWAELGLAPGAQFQVLNPIRMAG